MRVVLFSLILLQSLVFASNSNILAIDILKKDGELKKVKKNYVFFYKKESNFPRVRILVEKSYKQDNIQKEIKGIGEKTFFIQNLDCTINGISGRCYSYTLDRDDINNLIPKSPESLYIHDLTSLNSSQISKKKEYGKFLKENILKNQTLYSVYVASNNPNINSYIPTANGKLLNSGGFTHVNIIVEEKQEKILVENTADWIIYIGHGSSVNHFLSGSAERDNAAAIWEDTVSSKSISWKNVKGFLSFGCSIIDIGDFGNQNYYDTSSTNNCTSGNYCPNYYGKDRTQISEEDRRNLESPNPGKSWAQSMLDNNIHVILGFNYKAPLVFGNGGDLIIERFLNRWIESTEFLSSWEDKKLDLSGYVERGYLKQEDNDIYYSFAKTYGYKDLRWQSNETVNNALNFSKCLYELQDVDFDTENASDICKVYEYGIAKGYQDKQIFGIENKITRAEFLKMLLITQDIQDTKRDIQKDILNTTSKIKPFPDIELDSWYYPYVNYAKIEKIIKGYDDGTFKPDETIPFRQASKIIVNTLIGKIVVAENRADWWTPFIDKLKENNLPIYDLDHHITRKEMAEIVIKILEG